ncbi:uncharacterized protein EDB93DRAFT_1237159 [Suillus bovinus]|uniref:uncharacterized protein n=1 Tax=Suillus bovinus TaxID=48563 RepID=UPI001B87978F|nr:uncharacterized protein EDB93DRAFT_1237159 [Suillus bovinus]KAG2159901.1 hypothetical protein EDB93DRAFT_1237159 [Suillus bovinus]
MEAKVYSFDNFECCAADFLVPPPDGQPWSPFNSRLEFEIAEIMLEVGFNNQQTDRLIKLCLCFAIPGSFLTSHLMHTTHNLVCYTCRASAFDPMGSQLPPGGKPLAYILYADKTKLSSFSTAKDYPVYACLANLPTAIRNGRGEGGGYVVGWLPIVKDKKLHSGKPSWVDFKNTVWHTSFARIISSLASKSQTDQWVKCLDGVTHWFFLCILILSADFEERSVVSLTRGIMSLWPCPICLVPRNDLWDTSKSYRWRTSKESQAVINAARAKETFEEREELLKEQALCLIENAFWAVAFTCMHRALSHDCCHFNHGGLWSCHLWVELQKYVVTLGRAQVLQVDNRFKDFPHWRNLRHPNQVIGVTFTDSSIHEDISKMIIYATHDVLTETDSLLGYFLLWCVCLYLEMDMYAALEVHMANTIEEGRHTVQAFTALMKQYMTQTADDNVKNWNFPKLHMTIHIFDDIQAKGATCNYNTKPNKQMHRPLKDWYLNRTNFKNVAEQILCIDHWLLVADDIGRCISDFDKYLQQKSDSDGEEDDALDDKNTDIGPGADSISTLASQHVRMGSRQAPQTFCSIENAHKTQVEFTNFRIKLNAFLNTFLPACNILLPNGRRIHLQSDDTVDWKLYTDYLRCNPRFFNMPHFDWVFIRTQNSVILGCLDKQLNLLRVHAQLHAKAEFFSVQSIICGALLVQDSGGNPLNYFVVDTIDTDMFLRVREMHQQAGHPVRI